MSTNATSPSPSTGDGPPPAPTPFNPLNQDSTLLYSDGVTPIPFNTADISQIYLEALSLNINYGSQLGACFIMLAVVLAMTPCARFKRLPTIISIAALTLNTIRMVLLAVFFTTPFLQLYVIVSGDGSVVSRGNYELSTATTALSIPMTMLIQAALAVQAWSMLKLWDLRYKLPAALASVALVLASIALNIVTTTIQIRAILGEEIAVQDGVKRAYLAMVTASICWFCFLFNVRLVMHMWTNRSFLPSLRGLKAMDVLVITNGTLMLVPVLFSALEFFDFDRFETASLTQTSVVIVLPLGTLVAQRLANPAWFGSTAGGGSGGPSAGTGGIGGLDSINTNSTGLSSTRSGAMSAATTAAGSGTSTAKRPLLMSVRSREGGVVHRGQGAVLTHIEGSSNGLEKRRSPGYADGDEDLLVGDGDEDLERGVRVDCWIERREERLPSGSS